MQRVKGRGNTFINRILKVSTLLNVCVFYCKKVTQKKNKNDYSKMCISLKLFNL